ncbi:MAG: DUF2911 domain-containing protein [Gemmatimonadales bacterium]|nr:DUF2911 domain-containing protein [Gemmatimonadales bacterium]
MKLTLAAALLTTCTVAAAAQNAPRFHPSGRATSQVTLMTSEPNATPRVIRLDWGQPHLRGRALHTDSLVPYGQVWRTGANDATTLHTDFDLTLGGVQLPKGSYVVFTLPGRDGWQLILQTNRGQSIGGYQAANDAARVPLRLRTLAAPVEAFTMWLVPAASGLAGELRMAWGTSELSVPYTATP